MLAGISEILRQIVYLTKNISKLFSIAFTKQFVSTMSLIAGKISCCFFDFVTLYNATKAFSFTARVSQKKFVFLVFCSNVHPIKSIWFLLF